MSEFELFQVTLKANYKTLKMLNESSRKDKTITMLSIIKNLNKLCNEIIPILEEETEENKYLA